MYEDGAQPMKCVECGSTNLGRKRRRPRKGDQITLNTEYVDCCFTTCLDCGADYADVYVEHHHDKPKR